MSKVKRQIGALPWRKGEAGLEVLMVTTRTTQRWVIPKGWPMKGLSDADAAATEAFEEAGVEGRIAQEPFGSFSYSKISDSGKPRVATVSVFPLEVTREFLNWPEEAERTRKWYPAAHAAEIAGDAELVDLLGRFARQHASELSAGQLPVTETPPWLDKFADFFVGLLRRKD